MKTLCAGMADAKLRKMSGSSPHQHKRMRKQKGFFMDKNEKLKEGQNLYSV